LIENAPTTNAFAPASSYARRGPKREKKSRRFVSQSGSGLASSGLGGSRRSYCRTRPDRELSPEPDRQRSLTTHPNGAADLTDIPNSLAARDIAYYLHPATNARRHEIVGPMVIERGQGIYVYDDQGRNISRGLPDCGASRSGLARYGSSRRRRRRSPITIHSRTNRTSRRSLSRKGW
jgi:hypothetical protein